MLFAKAGKAARGTACFALACLLAAMLLLMRFRQPPQIVVEAMTSKPGAEAGQRAGTGVLESFIPEADTADVENGQPRGQETPETEPGGRIFVHVAGCVAKPGLYELMDSARVNDAVIAAGGMTGSADSDSVNIALPVKDGQQVYIPMRAGQQALKAEAPKPPPEARGIVPEAMQAAPPAPPPDRLDVTVDAPDELASGTVAAPGIIVDINTASAAELDTLPGIGPSTAAKIIEYRQENGPFASIEQLMDVSGIGPAKFEAMREMVVAGR